MTTIGSTEPINLERADYMAEVLVLLDDADEPLSTSDLKNRMNLNDTDKPRHAVKRLAENGLVETWKASGHYNYMPPKVSQITVAGREVVAEEELEQYVDEKEDSLSTRVERLENRVEKQERIIKAMDAYMRREVQIDVIDWYEAAGIEFNF